MPGFCDVSSFAKIIALSASCWTCIQRHSTRSFVNHWSCVAQPILKNWSACSCQGFVAPTSLLCSLLSIFRIFALFLYFYCFPRSWRKVVFLRSVPSGVIRCPVLAAAALRLLQVHASKQHASDLTKWAPPSWWVMGDEMFPWRYDPARTSSKFSQASAFLKDFKTEFWFPKMNIVQCFK